MVGVAALGLIYKLGVAEENTSHNDGVKIAALDEHLGLLEVHAHTHGDGGLDLGLYLAAKVSEGAVRDFHGYEGDAALMPAGGDGEAVYIAGLVQQVAYVGDIVAVAAAGHIIAAGDAQADGEVGADGLAHGLEGLDHEAVAVLDAAAILIGAVIGERAPELAI